MGRPRKEEATEIYWLLKLVKDFQHGNLHIDGEHSEA